MNIANRISQSKNVYALLGVSLLYFLLKGISYALIGSYVPILFITIIMLLFYGSFGARLKKHYQLLKFWAILIIIWAAIRLGLSIILKIDTTLTESHLREQFGMVQLFLSIGMLICGIGIIKKIPSTKTQSPLVPEGETKK